MKPPEAMEILKDIAHPEDYYMTPKEREALGMGVGALEYVQNAREGVVSSPNELLPGETE